EAVVVGGVQWDEEGHPDAILAHKINIRVGEGPAGARVDGSFVGPGSIFTSPLEAELVGHRRREDRRKASVYGVRVIVLQSVGAPAPGVYVEGAVLLTRAGVV